MRFNFRKFAKEVTGKYVAIKNVDRAYQTVKGIIVPNCDYKYSTFHEVCHYIISDKKYRKRYNLRYGKKYYWGYNSTKDSTEEKSREYDERLTGELQLYLIEKYDLHDLLFQNKDKTKIDEYLDYIRTYQKPIEEEDISITMFKRLKRFNKQENIDVEKILVANLKQND